jgi:hypothetical protein
MGTDRQDGDKPTAQHEGLEITVSEGRWRSVIRPFESQELALAGDNQLLGERIRGGCASCEELRLAADILTGRVKPKKKKLSQHLAEDRRQLAAAFALEMERETPGIKREFAVLTAAERFEISRSSVWTSLKLYESK